MNISQGEELFLRSLEEGLTKESQQKLDGALLENRELAIRGNQYKALREMLERKEAESFGPFFAERIAFRIKQLKQGIDYQIFFFFKRYQLLAAGIIIALLAVNILLSDQLSVKSILGFEEEAIDDVMAIDVLSSLTK
jgi:hypothetical protein